MRREIPLEQLQDKLFLMKCEVESVAGDELFIEVTSDRPDMLCAEGIARELRGIIGLEAGLVRYKVRRGDLSVKVEKSVSDVRPYIAGALVRNLKFTDDFVKQIMQLQEKLHLTYCRNRTKVSVGIHDAEKVTHELTYAGVEPNDICFTPLGEERAMNGNEVLECTAKGREYGWIIRDHPRYPMLYDSEKKVLSMPPILNGIVTQVTPETSDLVLDVTGTDMKLVNFVNNILVSSLAERGGTVEAARIVYSDRTIRTPDLRPFSKQLSLQFVNDTLGLDLQVREVAALLKRMRYGVKSVTKNRLTAIVPAYRADIMHAIDLVEDLAIAYGYNKLLPTMPLTATVGSEMEITKLTRKIRDLMVGLGFIEVLNYTMTGRQVVFEKMNMPVGREVEVANPLSSDFAVLRSWLMPGLLNFLSSNKHVSYPQRIFECGDVVVIDETMPTKTLTKRRVGAVACDHTVSYEDIQATMYSLLRNAGSNFWQLQKTEHPSFIKGRVAAIAVMNKEVGIIGEIHPQILENYNIENPVAAFELDLESTFGK